MIIINNTDIKGYEFDTEKTILNRIAVFLETLPEYLYFENIENKNKLYSLSNSRKKKEIEVSDILSFVRKNTTKKDFLSFISSFIKNFPNYNIEENKKTILYLWLIFNKAFENMVNINLQSLTILAETLIENKYINSEEELTVFWNQRRDNMKKSIELEIEKLKGIVNKFDSFYQYLSEIEARISTEVKIERLNIDYILNIDNLTLLEVFNLLVLNRNIPYLNCEDYHKILKDFEPKESWLKSEKNTLSIYYNDKTEDVNKNDYKYASIISDKNKNLILNFIKFFGRNYINNFYENIFLNSIDKKEIKEIKVVEKKEKQVLGIFYYPQDRLNSYVFSDLVLNDKVFSSFISIDESVKATKRKKEEGKSWLYIHFYSEGIGEVKASIVEKVVDRNNIEFKNEDDEVFPQGSPYIEVKPRSENFESIEKFRIVFSKLLSIYNEKYNEIVEEYRKFIPKFGIVKVKESKKLKNRPEKIAPEIFDKNYSRSCAETRIPTIITMEDYNKLNYKPDIMKFPRDEQTNEPKYYSDGKKQQYYVCLNPEYPYPGVQKNKLGNSEMYPYVPCCFKVNQKDKNNYLEYFQNIVTNKEKKQQDLIITDKIIGIDKFGYLSEKVSKLFQVVDRNIDYQYIRLGVSRNKSSFLSSVMTSLYKETKLLDVEISKREEFVENFRKELAKQYILAKQSNYDIDNNQLKYNISDKNYYLDPRRFIQFLERSLNCNIIVFNKDEMILPYYSQGFYRNNNPDNPYVFIYEHWGSESDHAKYPQCEVIIKWNIKRSNDTQYSFSKDDPVVITFDKIKRMLLNSYDLNKPSLNVPIPDFDIISQMIDEFGKCRVINLKFKGKKLSLFVEPRMPLPVKNENKFYKSNYEIVKEFIKEWNAEISFQNSFEISGMIKNFIFTIPIIEDNNLNLIEYKIDKNDKNLYVNSEEKSELEIFNKNKKYANYITEYLFWIFSNYLKKENINTITDKILSDFAKKYTLIKEQKYENIPMVFSFDNEMFENGKLIIQSEELLKRLMYVLKLTTIRDINMLMRYNENVNVRNYFSDISDFVKYENQIIIFGSENVESWIKERNFNLRYYDEILPENKYPYFFKNSMVNDKLYLVQNCYDLDSAINIGIVWKKKGYNMGIYGDLYGNKKNKYNFTLYAYKNKDNIEKYKINDLKENDFDLKILGYKISDINYYTVLLDI